MKTVNQAQSYAVYMSGCPRMSSYLRAVTMDEQLSKDDDYG